MQAPALAQRFARLLVQAGEPSRLDGEGTDALGVPFGVGVLRLDGVGEREDHLGSVLQPLGGEPVAERGADAGVKLRARRRERQDVIRAVIERSHRLIFARLGERDHRQQPGAGGSLDAPADCAACGRSATQIDERHRGPRRQQRIGRGGRRIRLDQGVIRAQRRGEGFAKGEVSRGEDRDSHARIERSTG